jgi:O-antigen/teichoic acid export membrane protein
MTGIRRAFVWASAARYIVMAINLATTTITARLVAPGEYGISVLGTAVLAMAEAVRELGGGAYLIQQGDLSREKVRTTFTVSLLVTLAAIAILAFLAKPAAAFFGAPGLDHYLLVAALAYAMGPFVYPVFALMSRELAFDQIAKVSVLMAASAAIASIALAYLGFSYMSFAWASVISMAVGVLTCVQSRQDWTIFVPWLGEWRSVIGFGFYDSTSAIASRIMESVPFFIFGKILDAEAVGLGQRAILLCLLPERVILAGVGAVALPAFSKLARDGIALKGSYLRAIELISAALWPALILLVLLAHPLVSLLLGRKWVALVPLVQILGAALMFSIPAVLQYPTMVAVGAIRHLSALVVLQSVVTIGVLFIAAGHGLRAVAWSSFLIVPANVVFALLLVRAYVPFQWRELAGALSKSAVVAVMSAIGPLAIMLVFSRGQPMPYLGALTGGLLGALGWLVGLWATAHPLLQELIRASAALARLPIAGHLRRLF